MMAQSIGPVALFVFPAGAAGARVVASGVFEGRVC